MIDLKSSRTISYVLAAQLCGRECFVFGLERSGRFLFFETSETSLRGVFKHKRMREWNVADGDKLHFWDMPRELLAKERDALIALHQPVFNKPGYGGELLPEQPCKHCRVEFTPKRRWQKYCGPTCQQAASVARHEKNLGGVQESDTTEKGQQNEQTLERDVTRAEGSGNGSAGVDA